MINTEKLEEFKKNARALYDSMSNKDVNALVMFTYTKVPKEDTDKLSDLLTEEFGKPMYMIFIEPFNEYVNRTITFGKIPDDAFEKENLK